MLVVLQGHGLGVLVCAVQLLEQYTKVGIRILVLESHAENLSSSFMTGPLPHCITSIPSIASSGLNSAALHHGNSSIMYLLSIHRAPFNTHLQRSMMEKPVAHESLLVKPCTFPSKAISYHPIIYSEYLRSILQSHPNVSFAIVKNHNESEFTIRNLAQYHGDQVIAFMIQNHKPHLSDMMVLSKVYWDGVPDWKMPEFVHWIRKEGNKSTPYIIEIDSHPRHQIFQVVSKYTFFDLNGALVTSGIIGEHLKSLLVNANLRWPRL